MMRKQGLVMAVVVGCSVLGAAAQDNPFSKVTYPEDLRKDLSIIRQSVEQSHPDPYRYVGKPRLDALFDSISASIKAPLTAEGFIAGTLPIFKAIGSAPTVLRPPVAQQQAYAHTEPLIPFSVAVIGDHLYLNKELKGFRSLPPGCELLRINDRPAKQILEKLRAGLVTDGANTSLANRLIEREFPVLYCRFVERTNRFKVVFRAGDGTTDERDIFALTKDEMRLSSTPQGYTLAPWRLEGMADTHTAWLTLETMDVAELERARIRPERLLNNVLEALHKSKATNLVIDVRGAGGADLGLAGQVFALIAMEPYRVVRSMSIRSGEVPDSYRYAKPAPGFFASVGGMYLPQVEGRRELKADDPRLKPMPPLSTGFQGKVYVLADGLTTGAGAAFVMMANRSGRARTVGGETGSNAAGFCGGQQLTITLPSSGCVLHIPLVNYVPDGQPEGPRDHGEIPASPVPQRPSDVARGRDTVREALLQLIVELQ